jgi:hypothetical protein
MAASSDSEAARAARAGAPPWLAAAAVLAISFPALLLFYARHPLLYDTDAFYHLAVGRAMAQQGFLHDLPWLRLSVLGPGFGDKELLFHVLLVPFVAWLPPLEGGHVALALLDSLILAAVAWLGCRAVGWWGLLAPLWLAAGSLETAWRLVRLRPELLSLLLLIAAFAAAGTRRYRLLGAIAVVYALAYTGFHALLAACWALFVFRGWARRRWDWPLLLYPLLGTLAGLLVHPTFPANLVVWKVQNADHFRLAGAYAPSQEMAPITTDVALFANLGWWAVALVVWRARRPVAGGAADDTATDLADAFGIAAVAFGSLWLLMSRFAVYAFPFATVWLLLELARRGETVGPRVRLPYRGSIPIALAVALAALLAVPGGARELARFARRTNPGPQRERLADREALARALPAGAKVAATWGDTPIYMLWAPQGRYLNALDPVFEAAVDARAYAVQNTVFAGDEPDVPLATKVVLDSDFLAWSLPGAPPRLLLRLAGDPRARPLHQGFHALFALSPAPPGSFVLDWRLVPGGALPPPADARLGSWPAYPRLPSPPASTMEGFVDASRVAPGCVAFAREEAAGEAGAFELAASGPTKLWRDGELLVSTGGNGAVLGEGVGFRLAAGRRITVLSCPGERVRAGFYLLRRG